MDRVPNEVNVISLNCWGLKFLSKYRNERLTEIGKRLASADPTPHIVGLQECWTQEDYRSIRDSTRHILPYGKFYHSGVFGGGLAILSKWPIEESSMRGYPLNGLPTAFWRGDWYVGKGVASAKIRIGPGKKDIIEVFTTHLHAGYHKPPNDPYTCHRTAQAWEISKLLRGASDRGHLVLALGDFNVIPLSLPYRIITTHAQIRDVWHILHPDALSSVPEIQPGNGTKASIPTIEFNLLRKGATCDSALNTWKWNKAHQKRLGPNKPKVEVPLDTPDPRGQRVDYVFISDGRNLASGDWTVTRVNVGMTERHPTLQCSLSDHFSVECTVTRRSANYNDKTDPANSDSETFLQSPTNSERQQLDDDTHTDSPTRSFLPLSTYDEILALVEKHARRERKERRYRLYHFIGSVFISIGCFVATWWSPRNFVAFILMVLSTLGLSAGVIDGLIGGLFIGSEIRALKEFEWEIRNVRAVANGELMEDSGLQEWY